VEVAVILMVLQEVLGVVVLDGTEILVLEQREHLDKEIQAAVEV